jgi:hypothetical protein
VDGHPKFEDGTQNPCYSVHIFEENVLFDVKYQLLHHLKLTVKKFFKRFETTASFEINS